MYCEFIWKKKNTNWFDRTLRKWNLDRNNMNSVEPFTFATEPFQKEHLEQLLQWNCWSVIEILENCCISWKLYLIRLINAMEK